MDNFFRNCVKNELLIKYYNEYNKLWQAQTSYPYLNYIGFNFSEKGINSVKFYFHVFPKISKQKVGVFLPTLEDFLKFYPFYTPTISMDEKNTGCAFSLKFYNNQPNPTQGFHFRLDSEKKPYCLVEKPQKIELNMNETSLPPGINYEYHSKFVLKKTYHYFNTNYFKNIFSEKFNLPFLKKADLLEYSESKNFYKLNSWYGNDKNLQWEEANLLKKDQKEFINFLCANYNLEPKVFGYYDDLSVKSIYLFSKSSNIPDGRNLTNKTHLDTFKNLNIV